MISLGIDVGFSKQVASTGLCVISPDHPEPIRCDHVRTHETVEAVRALLKGERPTSISIDGPLVPKPGPSAGFAIVNHYRHCERNLSGGIFQKRCKPGPTNSPRGQALHQQATLVANILREEFPKARVVEAFPNAFLGVMMPEQVFRRPIRRGIKSDVFWQHGVRKGILRRLVDSLYGRHSLPLFRHWRRLDNHDERAAFVCALTARAAEVGSFTSVAGADDGAICLPHAAFMQPWAGAALKERLTRQPQ